MLCSLTVHTFTSKQLVINIFYTQYLYSPYHTNITWIHVQTGTGTTTSFTGLVNTDVFPKRPPVWMIMVLSLQSSSWLACWTTPMGQSIRLTNLSRRSTTSPVLTLVCSVVHLYLIWKVCKNSWRHRCQNWSASIWTRFHCALNRSLISVSIMMSTKLSP